MQSPRAARRPTAALADLEIRERAATSQLRLELATLQAAFQRKEARVEEMRVQAKQFLAAKLAQAKEEMEDVVKDRDTWKARVDRAESELEGAKAREKRLAELLEVQEDLLRSNERISMEHQGRAAAAEQDCAKLHTCIAERDETIARLRAEHSERERAAAERLRAVETAARQREAEALLKERNASERLQRELSTTVAENKRLETLLLESTSRGDEATSQSRAKLEAMKSHTEDALRDARAALARERVRGDEAEASAEGARAEREGALRHLREVEAQLHGERKEHVERLSELRAEVKASEERREAAERSAEASREEGAAAMKKRLVARDEAIHLLSVIQSERRLAGAIRDRIRDFALPRLMLMVGKLEQAVPGLEGAPAGIAREAVPVETEDAARGPGGVHVPATTVYVESDALLKEWFRCMERAESVADVLGRGKARRMRVVTSGDHAASPCWDSLLSWVRPASYSAVPAGESTGEHPSSTTTTE
jgi:hypothetical protein